MDSTKEVVQKLAKLSIDPPMRAPIQDVNASRPRISKIPFGLTGPASGQTKNTIIKPEATAVPFTASTSPQSPDNIPLHKPLKTISRNLAESLARSGNTNNSTGSNKTTSITKCCDKMRMGVDKFLRRDASKGLKRWLKEKERRHDRRAATRAHRGGAISEGLRKRLGLKREGASLGQLGVIKEEEEEEEEEEGMKMEEDTVMMD